MAPLSLRSILPLLLALGACGPGAPDDPISALYQTDVRPPGEAPYSAWAPEVFESDEGPIRKLVSYTEVYDILDVYASMRGPQSYLQVRVGEPGAEPQLYWIKGVRAEIVDAAGERISQEFMCHLVAGIASVRGRARALDLVSTDARIATLSQGVQHKEYPPGFAVPVLSSDLLVFNSQVLNLNQPDSYYRVRHKVVTLAIRDSERRRPLRALTNTYAQTMVALDAKPEEAYPDVHAPKREIHGLACAMGQNADPALRSWSDAYGRRFSGHWVVEPGRHEYNTAVSRMLNLRHEARIHAIDVHLHPFAESLALRDVTTGETLFTSHARQVAEGRGLAHVETYSSAEGIPIHPDHEYSLVATYDNPTGEPQDAMALMYLAIDDPEFDPQLLGDAPETALRDARERQRLADAEERWRSAVSADPGDPVAYFQLGRVLARMGKAAQAQAALERSLELDPAHPEARRLLDATRAGAGSP